MYTYIHLCAYCVLAAERDNGVRFRVWGRDRRKLPNGNSGAEAPSDRRGQHSLECVVILLKMLFVYRCVQVCLANMGVRESSWENVHVREGGVGMQLSSMWVFKVSKKQFCFQSDWPPGAFSPDLKVVSRS